MKHDTPTAKLLHAIRSHPLVATVVLLVVVMTVIAAFWSKGTGEQQTAYQEVKRGNLLISVTEGGSLDAVSETIIRNMVEGTGRIIRIAPEGSYVKKGDLLVELDSSSAQDRVNQQEITVRQAELALLQAQKELEISASQTNSDFTGAQIQLEIAEIDLTKFKEGELAQLRRELELDADTIQEKLLIDEERYRYSTNLLAAGFETKATADGHRLTWLNSQKGLQQATNKLWMFQQFDERKQLTQYQSKVDEAKEELSRVIKQSEAKMAQRQADLETKQKTLTLNQDKLERDTQNLKAGTVLAPTDGLVVYATPEGRYSSESMIEEGATVRYRQEIIKLPDTSQMKLTVKVHEAHVGKVTPGQLAYVTLDLQPEKRYQGRVSRVAVLANAQDRWSNPNLKVYDTEILITEPLPDTVKPNVSASAEIIITNLTDVISVPVQAVTTLQGKPVVYLAGKPPRPVPVQVGLFNIRSIEITDGLKEGDLVLLSPPLDTKAQGPGENAGPGDEIGATNQITVGQSQLESTAPPRAFGAPTGDPENARATVESSGETPALGGQRMRGNGAGGGNRPDQAAMLKQFDKDGDGQLSEEERDAMRASFGRNRGGTGGNSSGGRNSPRERGGGTNN